MLAALAAQENKKINTEAADLVPPCPSWASQPLLGQPALVGPASAFPLDQYGGRPGWCQPASPLTAPQDQPVAWDPPTCHNV